MYCRQSRISKKDEAFFIIKYIFYLVLVYAINHTPQIFFILCTGACAQNFLLKCLFIYNYMLTRK